MSRWGYFPYDGYIRLFVASHISLIWRLHHFPLQTFWMKWIFIVQHLLQQGILGGFAVLYESFNIVR